MIRPLFCPEVNTAEAIQKSVLSSQQTMNPWGCFTSYRGSFISQANYLTSLLILWTKIFVEGLPQSTTWSYLPADTLNTGFKGTVHPNVTVMSSFTLVSSQPWYTNNGTLTLPFKVSHILIYLNKNTEKTLCMCMCVCVCVYIYIYICL